MAKKDDPAAAKKRMGRRRERLAAAGLKEAGSVIVPIHREADIRAIARQWTEEHLRLHQAEAAPAQCGSASNDRGKGAGE